jgi:hypothetical protein
MPLAKQAVQLLFAAADQKTTAKRLRPGVPSVAENVIQTKSGSYRKRGGFTAMSRTADTGSITTGKDLVIDGGVPVLRTADAVYARPAATWLKRGDFVACVPSVTPVAANQAMRPILVVVGTQRWHFFQDSTGKWNYSVTDSGIEVVSPTQVSSTAFYWGKAVATTGKVWLFAGPQVGGNTVKLFQFSTAAPSTAPTSTTFAAPTGVSVDVLDVLDGTANGNGIVVAIGSSDGGGIAFGGASRALFFGRLDTATGLVDGTGWVGDATITLGQLAAPAAWVKTGQSATTLHLLSRRGTNNHVFLSTVTAASLVSSTADLGAPVLNTSASGSITGYRDTGSGNIIIFATEATTGTEPATITKATWNGAALTSNGVLARARLTVADPFLVGTVAYLVVQHADGSSVALQNAYYVLDTSATPGRVVARALYGLGGQGGQIQLGGSFTNNFYLGWITPVTVASSRASVLVGSYDGVAYTVVRLDWDFAPTLLGPPLAAQDGQLVAFPGGWPTAMAAGSQLGDLTPGMFPKSNSGLAADWTVTDQAVSSNLTAGTYTATVLYAIIDSHGSIQRSSPSDVQSVAITAGHGLRFGAVPSLRVANTATARVFVEYYMSDPDQDTLSLVRRVANDPTADTIANQDITALPRDGAEILYTSGGALEHISAPPCTWTASWRNRILLGGTDSPGAEVWPSFELASGFGPAWNESLKFLVPDGSGKDVAGCALDYNYFVIFKADTVWLISGAGPDPLGVGSYANTLQQVSEAPGCSNPRSVVQTTIGVMYQATNGEIWLINRGGGAQRIGNGWDDHKSATVTAAVLFPQLELALFFTDSSKALVWDYGNPLPDEGTIGQSYVWNLPAAAVAAAVSGSSLYYADSTGVVRAYSASTFSDDGVAILRKLKFPLVLAGMRGYARLYRGQVVGQFVDQVGLKVTLDAYAGAAGETSSSTQAFGPRTVTGGPYLFEFRPNAGRVAVFDVTLEDTGSDLHEGASWDGLALEVGIKQGLPRLNTTQKF